MTCLAPLARRARDAAASLAYEIALDAVARRYGVPLETVRMADTARHNRDRGNGRFRPQSATELRQEALYLAIVVLDTPKKALARVAEITPRAARFALAAVEERREAPDVDRRLDELELEVRP